MENTKLIKVINSEELLRDSLILKLIVEYLEEIKINLNIFSKNSNSIELEFLDVISFNISGDSDFDKKGVLVSHYKLFITEEQRVYFSFDPYDEDKYINEDDNNYIICKTINLIR